jgi:hypothetical protein
MIGSKGTPPPPQSTSRLTRTQSGAVKEKIWGRDFHSPEQHRKIDFRQTLPNPGARGSSNKNDMSNIALGLSTISTVAGLGGFSRNYLKEGTTVIYIGGTWFASGLEAERMCSGFTIEIPEKIARLWKVTKRFLAMDEENNGRYLNDALDEHENNCKFVWNLNQGDPQKFCKVITVRDVLRWRELCVDYGSAHWEGLRLRNASIPLRSLIFTHHPTLDPSHPPSLKKVSDQGRSITRPIVLDEDFPLPPPLPASTSDLVINMGDQLGKFSKKVNNEVRAAIADSMTAPRFRASSKVGKRFSGFLSSATLTSLIVAETISSEDPSPDYQLIAGLPENIQTKILICFGIYSQNNGRNASNELSALKFQFQMDCCNTEAFNALSVKRSKTGFAKKAKPSEASVPKIFGITGGMMWSLIRTHKIGFKSEPTPVNQLVSTALLLMYDKGKRVGTVVKSCSEGNSKPKGGSGPELGRKSQCHTIPAGNVFFITPEGPGQKRMNALEYRSYWLDPATMGVSIPRSEWIVAHFASDKDARRKYSLWKKGMCELQDLLMEELENACIICHHKSPSDNFFSYRNPRGTMTKIHRKQIADKVKSLAAQHNLPMENFSTRSCRKSFGTQQEQSNSVFAIPSAASLNAAGGFEWARSSVTRTSHYTLPHCSSYSNLVTLSRGIEGTVTSRMDVILVLPPNHTGPVFFPPPISILGDYDGPEPRLAPIAPCHPGSITRAPVLEGVVVVSDPARDVEDPARAIEDNIDTEEEDGEILPEDIESSDEDEKWDNDEIFNLTVEDGLEELQDCITSTYRALGMTTRSRGGSEFK